MTPGAPVTPRRVGRLGIRHVELDEAELAREFSDASAL